MKQLNIFLKQLIQYFINWLVEQWRDAKTTANLNKEIRKYKETAEELYPQPQIEFKEKGVFGKPGWSIQITNKAFNKR